MNLSKVYSTQDTFEPEDIVRAKIQGPMIFGSILSEKLPDESEVKHGFRPQQPPRQELREQNPNSHQGTEDQTTFSARETERKSTPAPPEPISVPTPDPQPKKTAPAAQPPGMTADQAEKLIAESYEKGVQAGLQHAEEDFGAATKALLLITQQLDILRETILKNSVSEMQDLVLAIAEKIIRHSVQEQKDTIISTVEEAIYKAVKSDEFDIFVNPEDYDTVAAKSDTLIAGLNGLNNVIIKKDPSIEAGGCRIESDNCIVDATLVSQLDIIRNQLKQQD